MEDKITKEKLKKYVEIKKSLPKRRLLDVQKIIKYSDITQKALKLAEKNINQDKKSEAKEIIAMVKAYLSDSKYFKAQGNYVNAFAAINYAHGWLDCGSRLGIFLVKDSRLFIVS